MRGAASRWRGTRTHTHQHLLSNRAVEDLCEQLLRLLHACRLQHAFWAAPYTACAEHAPQLNEGDGSCTCLRDELLDGA